MKWPKHSHRLRKHKGVTYGKSDDGREVGWKTDGHIYVGEDAVSLLISRTTGLTDEDHAKLLALRDDPWEKVETLEDVVDTCVAEWAVWFQNAARGAGILVYNEGVARCKNDLCTRIRSWLEKSYDEENSYPSEELMQETGEIIRAEFRKDMLKDLTIAECVERLVELGAEEWHDVNHIETAPDRDGYPGQYNLKPSKRRVIVLPSNVGKPTSDHIDAPQAIQLSENSEIYAERAKAYSGGAFIFGADKYRLSIGLVLEKLGCSRDMIALVKRDIEAVILPSESSQ